jgi:hypothetical protein
MRKYLLLISILIIIIVITLINGQEKVEQPEQIRQRLENEKEQEKEWIESEKERLRNISVDSLIYIIENALEWVRRDTFSLPTIRWNHIEVVAMLLGEKKDKCAIPILEEFAIEEIMDFGDNTAGAAQGEAAKSFVLLTLSPNYWCLTNTKKAESLLYFINQLEFAKQPHYRGARLLLDNLNIDVDSSYTELLCHYLQEGNENVCYLASNLLAKNPHKIAFDCLKKAITDTTNISVRCNVIRVISLFPTKQEEIFTLLKTIFEDKNNPHKVRERALRSILGVGKRYNKTATVEYLTKITTDEYEELSIRQVADDLKIYLLQ